MHSNCVLSLIRSIKSQLTELELEWIIKGVDNVPEFPLHCCFTEEQRRLLRFLIIWTAKEAFLKACGSGTAFRSVLTPTWHNTGWRRSTLNVAQHLGIIYNLARLNVTPFRQERPAVPLRDTIAPAEKNTTSGFRVFPLPFVSLEKDGKPVQVRNRRFSRVNETFCSDITHRNQIVFILFDVSQTSDPLRASFLLFAPWRATVHCLYLRTTGRPHCASSSSTEKKGISKTQ